MNFNLTFSDELNEKILEEANRLDVTPTYFIEHLVLSALDNQKPFDYISAAAELRADVSALVQTLGYGAQFSLSDCASFQKISTSNPGLRGNVGRNFNKAVRNNSIPHVRRCTFRNGELKNVNGSAVYEIF